MKISVQKFADSTGVQRGYIIQHARGDKLPELSALIDVINTLEISPYIISRLTENATLEQLLTEYKPLPCVS